MGFAAVPKYIKDDDLKGIPPGHRFTLFFPIWKANTWEMEKDGKTHALRRVLDCPKETSALIRSIRTRQALVAERYGDDLLTLEAESVSPFLTGIGQEHPVENGFTFMNPFGIPCLPGSGVKGVVRRAMEGMALGEWPNGGIRCSLLDVWILFGFEATSGYLGGCKLPNAEVVQKRAGEIQQAYRDALSKEDPETIRICLAATIEGASLKEDQKRAFRENPKGFVLDLVGEKGKNLREAMHNRGRLIFWDVYPEIAGNRLDIDILTPHYGEYYQGKSGPSDCGQPIPNPFLTVPPGSKFTFHVHKDGGPLPGDLETRWRPLLERVFETAFYWLGFGAKTSVGYGQMRPIRKINKVAALPKEEGQAKTGAPPEPPKPIIWEKAYVTFSPGGGGIVTASSKGKQAKQSRDKLKDVPSTIEANLFGKKRKVDGVRVEVEPVGNGFRLLRILE